MEIDRDALRDVDWHELRLKRRRGFYSGPIAIAAFGVAGLLGIWTQSTLVFILTAIIWAGGFTIYALCWFAVYFAKCPSCGGDFHRIPRGTSFRAILYGTCAQCGARIPKAQNG